MTFRTCPYEKELRQALKDGHWPAGCGPELRQHVQRCSSCGDLALVTEALHVARNQSLQESAVTPDLLWWRAQLRRRRAATERVGQPVTVAQIFAWAVSLVAAIGFVVSQYSHGLRWSTWWSEVSPARILHAWPNAGQNLDWNPVLLIPTLCALALVAGVVVYLLSEKPQPR